MLMRPPLPSSSSTQSCQLGAALQSQLGEKHSRASELEAILAEAQKQSAESIGELESRLMQEKSQHGVTGNKLLQQEEVGASLETQLGEARSKVS